MPECEIFGHFHEFESLDFLDFAYYDRQALYLAGKSQEVAKNIRPQNWVKFGPTWL